MQDPASSGTASTHLYDAIVIGSGFAGICSIITLRKQGITNVLMLEQEDTLGGTWWKNNYPGAAVDVPSHIYCFSFEPYRWTRLFAEQKEILAYTNYVIDKHKLADIALTSAKVVECVFREPLGRWLVELADGRSFVTRTLINAGLGLNQLNIPDIRGAAEFKGASFHTGAWDWGVDYEDKRVGVIGNGASAVQVIPAIADAVKQLHVFQRTPHWTLPRPDRMISERKAKILAKPIIAKVHWLYSLLLLERRIIPFMWYPKLLHRLAGGMAKAHLAREVNDLEMRNKLTPTFMIGCKRILLTNDYYATLQKEHVHLETEGIDSINGCGVLTNTGDQVDLDVLIYATGFDISGQTRENVVGLGGLRLKEKFRNGTFAYLFTQTANFPNYFMVPGPNAAMVQNSGVASIELCANLAVRTIKYLLDHDLKYIAAKEDAEVRFNEKLQRKMQRTVWIAGGCNSWYKNPDGTISTLNPFSGIYSYWVTRRFVPRNYVLEAK